MKNKWYAMQVSFWEIVEFLKDVIPQMLKNKKVLIATYLVVALGVSSIIGGAITYLATYGTESAGALQSNDGEAVIILTPEFTPDVTSTQTPAGMPAAIEPAAAGGQWTVETCQAAAGDASWSLNAIGSICLVWDQASDQWIKK